MFKGWLGGANPKYSVSSQSLTALDEPKELEQALKVMSLLMDDNISAAEAALEEGHTSFHKLAAGVLAFLRASLGFEPDIMKEASERLAEAETWAERDRKKAVKENHHRSSYPPGTEFALCHAEAQLMSAVVGVLSESVVESMRAFYRLRTAYKTLEGIMQTSASVKFSQLDGANESKTSIATGKKGTVASKDSASDGSSNEFNGIPSRAQTPASLSEEVNNLNIPGSTRSEKFNISGASGSSPFDNPVDVFIHSGANLCFGLLLLILGMVPPSLGKVMSIVGFRGDRERGIQMLWQASKADNVHGAISVLVLLQFYGNAVQFCDIVPEENHLSGTGYPRQRCHDALARVRVKYPNSALWKLEEARMEAVNGKLEKAIEMLSQPVTTQMRQVEALMLFENSLNQMFLHRYEVVAEGFIKLTTVNSWSHGLYRYFAAVCYIELYRKFSGNDEEKSKLYAGKAESLLEEIPSFMGKKRFMAQGLPLELFAERKIKKWQMRSKERGVRLVDGVGVSPVEEMIYFWNGYKRITQPDFEVSMNALQWRQDDTKNEIDEQCIRSLLTSVVLRCMGKIPDAKESLQKVLDVDRYALKATFSDEWMAPTAHYEWAVILWKEHGPGEQNEEIKKWLAKAANWGPYELDTRVGLRVTTGLDTINRYISGS